MLLTKELSKMNTKGADGKKVFTAIPFLKPNFEFGDGDATENVTTKNSGVNVKNKEVRGYDGKEPDADWNGTAPTQEVSKVPVNKLLEEMVAYLKANYGSAESLKDIPEEDRPWHIALRAASDGVSQWMRAAITKADRPAPLVDIETARERQAKAMVAGAAARGKTLSYEKAYARVLQQEQEDEE